MIKAYAKGGGKRTAGENQALVTVGKAWNIVALVEIGRRRGLERQAVAA